MKRHYFLMLAAFVASMSIAYADSRTISGEVIDKSGNMLRIRQPDQDVFEVHWNDDFTEAKRLNETEEGDQISVEAEEEGGDWQVRRVKDGGGESSEERTVRDISGVVTHDSDDMLRIQQDDGDVFEVHWKGDFADAQKLKDAEDGDRVAVRAQDDENNTWWVQEVKSVEDKQPPAGSSPLTGEVNTLSGKVESISGDTFLLRAADGNGMAIRMNQSAKGANKLDDLDEGDQITVKAERNQTGEWVIQEVIK